MLVAELICDAFGHRSSSRVARCGYRRMPMDCAPTWSLPGWRNTDVRAAGREALPASRPFGSDYPHRGARATLMRAHALLPRPPASASSGSEVRRRSRERPTFSEKPHFRCSGMSSGWQTSSMLATFCSAGSEQIRSTRESARRILPSPSALRPPAGATSTARSSESYLLKDRGKAGLTTLPATRQGRGVNYGPSLTPEERTPRRALPSGQSDALGRAFTVAVAVADSRVGKMGLLPAGGVVGIEQCAT